MVMFFHGSFYLGAIKALILAWDEEKKAKLR
jgi:hypothetical protein